MDFRKSSMLQAVLMEHIDAESAAAMHQQTMHPYSQYLEKDGDKFYWCVCTTSEEAYGKMIIPLLAPGFDSFDFTHSGNHLAIISKNLTSRNMSQMLDEFYQRPMERTIRVRFKTPTAFKSNGRYVVVPDLRLLFQNLMMRYTAASDHVDMLDQETLEQLSSYAYVSGYRLSTISFPISGKKIPGFVGNMTIRMDGPETLARYVRLLLEFAEYSGVGIKTGMGMGAIQIEKGEARDDRQRS